MPFAMVASEGRAYCEDPRQFMSNNFGNVRRSSHHSGPFPSAMTEAASRVWNNNKYNKYSNSIGSNNAMSTPKIVVESSEDRHSSLDLRPKSRANSVVQCSRPRAKSLGSANILDDLEKQYEHGSKLNKCAPEYFTDSHFSEDFLTDAKSLFDMLKKE